MVLYNTLVLPKLRYASAIWNSVTLMDAFELGRIQRKLTALCCIGFVMAHGTVNVKAC
jgi:hypothetical protein